MAHRFEGKNLDEALTNAAQSLGVDRHRLKHSTISEKRGFLGGMKRIVIEVEVTEAPAVPPAAANAPAAEASTPALVASSAAPPRPSGPPRSDRGRGPRGGGRGRGGAQRGGQGGRSRGRKKFIEDDDDFQTGDFERFAGEVPEQGPEGEQAKVVREWIERVIESADLSLTVRTEENETQVHIRLYGRDARRLLDRNGELLDAIQVLANKALTGRKVEKEIELDCEEFKERRTEELEQRARALADRVRRDGREQLLPAMSPVERRIIHLALQDDADVATESRGDGFFKRVAVIPRAASQES